MCQDSYFHKMSREENEKGNSKNSNCQASVTCVVKLDTQNTRKIDPLIKVLVCIFIFISTHILKIFIMIGT